MGVTQCAFQDTTQQWTFEQFAVIHGADHPVFMDSSQDRVHQLYVEQNIESPVDQILDVPVPQTIKQFSECEDGISNKIQRRTAEHVVSIPVLEMVEELVCQVFSQEQFLQRI